MAAARLSARTWTSALLRRVQAAGEFATVLRRGDDSSGAVVLIHRQRNGQLTAMTRVLGAGGDYVWTAAARDGAVDGWLERQSRFDPDLWIIELDTPDLARFVSETIA